MRASPGRGLDKPRPGLQLVASHPISSAQPFPGPTHPQAVCEHIPDDPGEVGHLDGDTAISHRTFTAALAAAGAVCTGVDAVVSGRARHAFAAVRPPGHHAGPQGVVTCARDPHGR